MNCISYNIHVCPILYMSVSAMSIFFYPKFYVRNLTINSGSWMHGLSGDRAICLSQLSLLCIKVSTYACISVV